MERINQFPLYELGKKMQTITGFTGEVPPSAVFWELWQAINAIEDLIQGRPFPVGISKAAARAVHNELQTIMNQHFYKDKEDGTREFGLIDNPIPAFKWNALRNVLARFETVFAAEMGEATTYFVPRRGIYFTPALIDSADESFPIEIMEHIPQKARDDWRSAGRCLAFSLLSATGFHVARAVEATLEVYYQLYTAKSGTLNGWNDYIQALEAVVTSGANPAPVAKTIAELKQMKDDYRNPVMHPRVTLTENDARMLFDNGESLIIAIM